MSRTRAATARRPRAPRAPAPGLRPRPPGRSAPPAAVPAPQRRAISGATVATPLAARRPRAAGPPLLDSLLRCRAWIWLLGIALGGIVFMQVSLLKMNAGISRVGRDGGDAASAPTRSSRARSPSSPTGDRIRTLATGMGLIAPDAGSVDYLERPARRRRAAARRAT